MGWIILLILPFSFKDSSLAHDFFKWVHELDGELPQHSCALLASPEVPDAEVKAIVAAARLVFKNLDLIRPRPFEDKGWPEACNHLFQVAVKYAKQRKQPFFWCEVDAIPLKAGWLDAFAEEYAHSRKPFLGYLHDVPIDHINGVAIYPHDVEKYNPECLKPHRNAHGPLSWDVIEPQLTIRHTHVTQLIHHQYWQGDIVGSTAPTFKSVASLKMLRPRAVLFHRNKDGSLIKWLREAKKRQSKSVSFLDKLKSIGKPIKPNVKVFYHSGDLGDIIYSLPTILGLGGGHLRVGPMDKEYRLPTRERITEGKLDFLHDLIVSQPYIEGCDFGSLPKDVHFNLNQWRLGGKWPIVGRSLSSHQRIANGLDVGDERLPWLTVEKAKHCSWPIVIARSARYLNPQFPWGKLIKRHGGECVFVGLPDEHAAFCKSFGRVPRIDVGTALELASIIASAKLFIGNQSLPYAIAEGLKVNSIQETFPKQADCIFQRDNARFGSVIDFGFVNECLSSSNEPAKATLPACIFYSAADHEKVMRLAAYCEKLDGTKLNVFTHPDANKHKQPKAGNFAFRVVLEKMRGRPFIWLENDSIPLKAGWAQALTDEYQKGKKEFMLSSDQNPPGDMIGGIGVYGRNAASIIPNAIVPPNTKWGAWDGWLIDNAPEMLHRTPLIQHSYAIYDAGGALLEFHRFPRDAGILRPTALIFHADKHQDLLSHAISNAVL